MPPLTLENRNEHIWGQIGQDLIWGSSDVKVLGVTTANDQSEKHISNINSMVDKRLSVPE